MTPRDLKKYLSKRPRTMDQLVRRYGWAPIVEMMREISNTSDSPVLYAPAWDEAQIFVYWIEPEKRTAPWRRPERRPGEGPGPLGPCGAGRATSWAWSAPS